MGVAHSQVGDCPAAVESDTIGSVDPNATALELRATAYRLLAEEEGSSDGDPSQAQLRGLHETLEDSFGSFVDHDRVRSEDVFEDDRTVAARTGRFAPNVTAHLVAADRRLALTALDDAETASQLLDSRGVAYHERAIERDLQRARVAIARAEHTPGRLPPSPRRRTTSGPGATPSVRSTRWTGRRRRG